MYDKKNMNKQYKNTNMNNLLKRSNIHTSCFEGITESYFI